ncbi:TrmH family RNA methyltransferase [Tenacibaculum sp. UWU-22]|uniref:TrmH family RNA methyltransferase n=1 Tax=Tenacibaculum sp. UWU-22 TaxID=3234187 RepID=UPI0034DAFB42
MDKNLLHYLETYVTSRRKKLFHEVLEQRTRHFTVVLENIYQPHNTSAVVRTCDIFGIQDVYTVENTYLHKVSRHVAKGSQKWLDFHRYKTNENNTKTCLTDLKNKGYKIIATTPHNNSCMLSDFDVTQKSAFVFGVEKEGVSEYVKQHANGFLKIPMFGFTESLNISVAAAIILQSVTARLKQTEVSWQLTSDEKEKIYFDWITKTVKNVDNIIAHYYNNIVSK